MLFRSVYHRRGIVIGESLNNRQHDKRSTAPGSDAKALLCLALTALLTAVYSVTSMWVRPQMYSDSAFGFLVWDSMRRGAAFNHFSSPDAMDIARDASGFGTTWTPGQYLLPGLLEAAGLDLGLAIAIVVMASAAIGTLGWYSLYRAFGFSVRMSAFAIFIVACSRPFLLPFYSYTGGEILLFAAVPWVFLLVWRLRDLRWHSGVTFVEIGRAHV